MILNKMMAKNPKDRYQRPIHLVHHLMQVARQIGVADELSERRFFVETPLPGQPNNRPILLVGLALAVLVAVTLLLSFGTEPAQWGTTSTTTPDKKPKGAVAVDRGVGEPKFVASKDPVPPMSSVRPKNWSKFSTTPRSSSAPRSARKRSISMG